MSKREEAKYRAIAKVEVMFGFNLSYLTDDAGIRDYFYLEVERVDELFRTYAVYHLDAPGNLSASSPSVSTIAKYADALKELQDGSIEAAEVETSSLAVIYVCVFNDIELKFKRGKFDDIAPMIRKSAFFPIHAITFNITR